MPQRTASRHASGYRSAPGAVREMTRQLAQPGRRLAEALDLLPREVGIGLGRGEMAHHPDDVARQRGELGEPPAAHARVELEVDRNAFGHAAVRGDELEPGSARLPPLRFVRRAHHDDARVGEGGAKRERLRRRRHRERRRASPQRRPRDVHRAVPVAVRLDDGPQLRRPGRAPERLRVPADRSQVEGEERALHLVRPRALPESSRGGRPRRARPGAARARRRDRGRPQQQQRRPGAPSPSRERRRRFRSGRPRYPAVASEGGPMSLTIAPFPGAATIVSGPLRRTTQSNRSAAVRAASSRCAPTQEESVPSRRAISPACGVSTVAATRSNGSSSKSASASTTAGTSMRSSSSRTSARRPSPRPSPGPSASAPAFSAASHDRVRGVLVAPADLDRLERERLDDRKRLGGHGERDVARVRTERREAR